MHEHCTSNTKTIAHIQTWSTQKQSKNINSHPQNNTPPNHRNLTPLTKSQTKNHKQNQLSLLKNHHHAAYRRGPAAEEPSGAANSGRETACRRHRYRCLQQVKGGGCEGGRGNGVKCEAGACNDDGNDDKTIIIEIIIILKDVLENI